MEEFMKMMGVANLLQNMPGSIEDYLLDINEKDKKEGNILSKQIKETNKKANSNVKLDVVSVHALCDLLLDIIVIVNDANIEKMTNKSPKRIRQHALQLLKEACDFLENNVEI